MSEPLYPRTISFTVESLEDLDRAKDALNHARSAIAYEAHVGLNLFHAEGKDITRGMAQVWSDRAERNLPILERISTALWAPRVARRTEEDKGNA